MAAADYIAGIHRRRGAAQRLPFAACGRHSDPWPCRCKHPDAITDQYVNGYLDAAQHLLDAGLTPAPNVPAMREMWRRGGAHQRLAQQISELWEVAA